MEMEGLVVWFEEELRKLSLILFWLMKEETLRSQRPHHRISLRRSTRSQLPHKQLNTNCSDSDSDVYFTLTSSEINTKSGTIHAPKSSSEHHTNAQFLQFAIHSNDVHGDKFSSSKSREPKVTAYTVKRRPSSASPNVHEADWLPANPRRGSPKVASLPVLPDKYTNKVTNSTAASTQRDSTSFMAAAAPAAAAADSMDRVRHCSTMLLASATSTHQHLLLNNQTAEGSSKSRSNSAPAINSSDATSQIPVAHNDTKEESEHHSNPNPCVGERILEKTKRPAVTWYVATAAVHHLTGNRGVFITFQEVENSDLCVYAADGTPLRVCGSGNVDTGTVALSGVWYVPGLDVNLVSVGQLADLDYSIGFARGSCTISNADNTVVGMAHASGDGLYEVDFLQLPLGMA